MGDLTQEIRTRLEPLIPPQGSPTTMGASPHHLLANHVVAGLTNTLGGLSSRHMPTPAVIPRSPFVPRTAQPPYSQGENSMRAELDQLELTALRAMVDVEPYGSSDLCRDPSDDERPSMTSASPCEEYVPEDPETPSGKKKNKTRKTKRHDRRRSLEAKAIATSKIVVHLLEFTGKDLSGFAENFGRLLRMTNKTRASQVRSAPAVVQDQVPGEAGQADRDEVHHYCRRVGYSEEASRLPTRLTSPSGARSRT